MTRESNRQRKECLAASDGLGGFDWVRDAVLGTTTRIAAEMDPVAGRMSVVGYERAAGSARARQATNVLRIDSQNLSR